MIQPEVNKFNKKKLIKNKKEKAVIKKLLRKILKNLRILYENAMYKNTKMYKIKYVFNVMQ